MTSQMNQTDYTREALRTESIDPVVIGRRLKPDQTVRLLHAALGMTTEAAEVADVLKKGLFYGKGLDAEVVLSQETRDQIFYGKGLDAEIVLSQEAREHIAEEVGDLLWYVAIACDALGIPMQDIMAANIRKLRARYPERFTEEAAVERDVAAEQEALRHEQSA
jgi:NTP pyrophosphatase (non-canonical NTP hydrolase)